MIHWTCQSCGKKLRTADTDAGKNRPCPKCRAMILVPQPADVELELASESERPAPPVPRTARNRLLVFGVVVGLVVIALGVFVWMATKRMAAEQAEKATSEKDRDYLEILQLKYENAAVLALGSAWSREYPTAFRNIPVPTGAVFRDPGKFVQPVFDESGATSDLIEKQIVRKRTDFIARHGQDFFQWGDSFKKSFPERDLIFDEIKLEINLVAGRQVVASHHHLSINNKFVDARYCEDYFREMAPKFVAEVREEARNLRSVKALRAKVLK